MDKILDFVLILAFCAVGSWLAALYPHWAYAIGFTTWGLLDHARSWIQRMDELDKREKQDKAIVEELRETFRNAPEFDVTKVTIDGKEYILEKKKDE